MSDENKTTLRLEINKTIQPKKYEPIKIIVDITETFCWKDEKDREKKMEEYTQKLAENFVTTFDLAAKRIGEGNRCIGRVITSGNIPVSEPETSNDDEFDF